jgi:hypothetical protein
MMNKGPNQEKRERFYLEKFLEALRIKVDAIERGANPPDFILKLSEKNIAVELTEFHSSATGVGGHPRRALEEEWQKIQQVFEQERKFYSDLDSISGLLFFRQLEIPPKGKQKQFVTELLNFARDKLGDLTKKYSNFKFFGSKFPLLNSYLKCLSLCNADCYITWGWNHSVTYVGLSESELKRVVCPKLKMPRPPEVKENWLLVVSGHQLSQCMGLPKIESFQNYQELNSALEHGPYDMVYIFQYMFDRVLLWKPTSEWTEV